MIEKKSIIIAQANEITRQRQQFSLLEKRVIYQIIAKIRREFVEGKNGERTLFNDLCVRIDEKILHECTAKNDLRAVREAMSSLRHRDICINKPDGGWLDVNFISYAEWQRQGRYYEVGVSNKILPYFVELAEKFTTFDLYVAVVLKSKWSQVLYEYCSMYVGRGNKTFFLDVNDMRERFDVGDKYPNGANFKNRILEVARKEIKELFEQRQSPLYFEYFPDVKTMEGRRVTRYWFKVHTRESDEQQLAEFRDLQQQKFYILGQFNGLFKRDKKYVKRVAQEFDLHPNIITPFFNRFRKMQKEEEPADIARLTRYILKEDYGIK